MGYGLKCGAGASRLNFKVVIGEEQPASPGVNTLWVNTEEPSDGWVISATAPEEPTEGMVWITEGTSGLEFNALKKNGLWVCPTAALQYLEGEWVLKEGWLWDGESWQQFGALKEYLIRDGAVDFDAHPYTYKKVVWNSLANQVETTTGTVDGSVIKTEQTYEEKPALWLATTNGYYITHNFTEVTVPSYATRFVVEYYLLAAYNHDPVFSLGSASASADRGSAVKLYDGSVSIDVSGLQGQTLTLSYTSYGNAYNESNYIGNAWFE